MLDEIKNMKSYSESSMILNVRELKANVDILILQLSTGSYASEDTLINNWEHLLNMGRTINTHLSNPCVMNLIVRTDLNLAADLIAVGRAITIIENLKSFF